MWVERLWSGRWSATYVHYEPNLQFLLMAKFLLPLSVVVTLCMCCHPCPYSTEALFTDVPQCHKTERKWFQKKYVQVASAGYFANFFCKRYRPYSGKLSRKKTFANFAVLWLFAKVFSVKFGTWHWLVQQKWAIRESFLDRIVFSPICESFLPRKFLAIRYHVLHLLLMPKL